MNPLMATRKPSDDHATLINCTFYTLHMSQRTTTKDTLHNIVDYSEYRLRRYADTVRDAQQSDTLEKLIQSYVSGNVAVAWVKGRPVWQHVTKAA